MSAAKYVIEIATTDYHSAQAAVAGGADRIELCTALSEGGLTPSMGLIEQCRTDFNIALFPILRPRGGDFLYSNSEFEIIKKDALLCKKKGCDGVVVGFLNNDGTINKAWTSEIVAAVYPLEVTFHRAFDRCRDPFEALEVIIDAGCQRILTSGQKPAAPEGISVIKQLITQAAERIVIMPGSGVRAATIKTLADETGAVEFHSSLKTTGTSAMQYRQPSFAHAEESYTHSIVVPQNVVNLRNALYHTA